MAWSIQDIPSQEGRLAVVTGPGGLGFETALGLCLAGAEVIVAGRNPSKGAEAVSQLKKIYPQAKARFEPIDLGSLSSIKDFSDRLSRHTQRLDLLVNNAGVMMPPTRQLTSDGYELQFGTNYLGHFALTNFLVPLLREAKGARVVNVTSKAHTGGEIVYDNLQFERSYNAYKAYAASKLAQLHFSITLQHKSELNSWGICSNSAHPGWANTSLFQNGPGKASYLNFLNEYVAAPLFAQTSAEGALPTLYAATSPNAVGGALYGPCGWFEMRGPPKRSPISASILKAGSDGRLWDVSIDLIKEKGYL